VLHDIAGQEVEVADFGAHLLQQEAARPPGIQMRTVSANELGNQCGIATVIFGATLTVTPLIAFDQVGRQNINLGITVRPQKVDQQVVRGFQPHHALSR